MRRHTTLALRGPCALALALLVLLPQAAVAAQGGAQTKPDRTPTIHKSYVCKYVGSPGVNERLQTGQNPVYVADHSLPGSPSRVHVGQTFGDAHDKSVVLLADTDRPSPEPTVDACPAPEGPPADSCDNLDGAQPLGTECTKAPTTRSVTGTDVSCDGHGTRAGTETTSYTWDGSSWVAGAPTTAWGSWSYTPLTTGEAEQQGCAKEPTSRTEQQTRSGCDNGVERRTVTETTTYDWDGHRWVGTTTADDPAWTHVRDLTADERSAKECDGDVQPPPTTDVCDDLPGDQAPGTACSHALDVSTVTVPRTSCDSGYAERTVTTTTPYAFVDGLWVAQAPQVTYGAWTGQRALTDEEKAQLGGCAVIEPPAQDACASLPGTQPPSFTCDRPATSSVTVHRRKVCGHGVQVRERTRTVTWTFAEGAWVRHVSHTRGPWTFLRHMTRAERMHRGCLAVSPPQAPAPHGPPVAPVVTPPTSAAPKPSTGGIATAAVLPATGAGPGLPLWSLLGAGLVLVGGGLLRLRPRRGR